MQKNPCPSIDRTIMVDRSLVQAQVGSCDPVCRVCGKCRLPENAESAIDVIGTAVRVLAPWVTNDASEPEILFPRIYVPPLLADLFDDMFSPIARGGAGRLEVVIRLQKAYASLASIGDKECKRQAKRHWELKLKRAQSALILDEEKKALASLDFD